MSLTRSAALALSLAVPVAIAAQAPPPPLTGTGLLVGQVVDGLSGKPISDAAVTATMATKETPYGRQLGATATDSDGHFVLRGLAAGRITLEGRKSGYIEGSYGALESGGAARPLELPNAGRIGGLTIRLWPNASISGTVLDERGDPIMDITVQALKRSLVAGRWRVGESFTFLHQARTDDRGEYRISDLTPGDYVIVVASTVATSSSAAIANLDRLREAGASSPQYTAASAPFSAAGAPLVAGGSPRSLNVGDMVVGVENPSLVRSAGDTMPVAFPTLFYPGVQDASAAQVITIGAGQDRSGLDFTMKPVRAVRVSGTVNGPSGPASGIPLRLMRTSADQLQNQFDSAATVSGAGGSFAFLGVTEGDYVLKALDLPRPPLATQQVGGAMVITRGAEATAQPTLWGTTSVAIGNADVKDVVVTVSSGTRITGTVVTEGGPASGAARPINVDIEPADGKLLAARATLQPIRVANGTFASQQLPPGRYLVRVGSFSTVTWQGRDVTDLPIELGNKDVTDVVITARSLPDVTLSGTVRARVAADLAKSTVLIFPANRDAWVDYGRDSRRMQKSGVSRSGGYSVNTLPAGDYVVVAADDEPKNEWRDPAYLALLAPLGTTVALHGGQPTTQDLSAVRLPPASLIRREPIAVTIEDRDDFVSGPFVPDDDAQQTPARDTATAQPPAAGTGAIAGVVTEKAASTPLRNAVVLLTCTEARYGDTAITDASGRFAFRGIPAARCTISVTKPAYLGMRYGAAETGKPGTAIAINGSMPPIAIALPRAGVISGTIRDERGQPVRGVSVSAMTYDTTTAERVLTQSQRATNPTDNRGNYRISGLAAGEYFIAVNRPNVGYYQTIKQTTSSDYKAALKELEATAPTATTSTRATDDPQQDVGYVMTFYPGTPFVADAAKVVIAAGEERNGTDVTLSIMRLATVKVRATGPDGQPPAGILARLFREEVIAGPLDSVGPMMLPFPQPGGVISLGGIAPGRYIVDAGGTSVPPGPLPEGGFSWSPGTTTGLPMYGQATVIVDGRDVQIDVPLNNAVTVTGKIVFENTGVAATTAPLAGMRAALYGPKRGGLEFRTLFNPADAAGVITYENVIPAAYRVQTTAPRGWMVKSATINGVDAADIPADIPPAGAEIVVTFTDRVTELSGTLQSGSGTPAPGYTVIVFAADQKFWRGGSRRIVTARPATDGRFVATGLPPGDYRIAAVTDVKQGEWFDPAFLEQLVPASVTVTIGDGEKKVQNLQIK